MLTEAGLSLELNVVQNTIFIANLLVLKLLSDLCIVQMLDALILYGDDWNIVVLR